MLTTSLAYFLSQLEPGDVAAREGLQFGHSILAALIREKYNHTGIAVTRGKIFHVEERGYETICSAEYYDHKVSGAGALVRFFGPAYIAIREEVGRLIAAKVYAKMIGNPFSSARNLNTVNCNELVHWLYKKAVLNVLRQSHERGDIYTRDLIWTVYFENGSVLALGPRKVLELPLPAGGTGWVAETVGSLTTKNSDEVHPNSEASEEGFCPYDSSASSFKMVLNELCSNVLYRVPRLDAFTPETFLRSQFFRTIAEFSPGKSRP